MYKVLQIHLLTDRDPEEKIKRVTFMEIEKPSKEAILDRLALGCDLVFDPHVDRHQNVIRRCYYT